MHFDDLLKNAAKIGNMPANDQSKASMQFPANWCQGRTAFGGLSAALLYQAMRQRIEPSRRLLSLSTNFVGPLLADSDFSLQVEVLREGKSSTQVLAKAIQNDQVSVIVQACFAKSRPSGINVPVSKKMQLKPVDPRYTLPFQSGAMPEFFQHVDLCPQQGAMPFAGADTSHLGGWMRLKHNTSELNEAHIIALTDAWPPTLLQMFKQPAPASSMSWYLEFVQAPQLDSQSWLGFEAITHHCKDGYGLEDGCIWSESGELIALTRQTVALFD
ncbi:thioesterase family protein [Pseudoalteromonas shioyasakiensis]|uniref:acyl-CoA thioesterase n=1 Tax=Pseudoalteromonas shioyasakiensis TaxID=1190813 RepID=UPI0021197531|nr:thioesterase family protein [Pseudoalteromonas shioyasakiensis]MCQ8878507.1 thioesterase family protein [Pseudoalteromonas shioyasakiensis]